MSQPYVGEIRMFGGNFAPVGWQFCNGSLLQISEFETLFNLIGTTYGGDGQATFAVPDLRGRLPVHMGTGSDGSQSILGQLGGAETVLLTTNQIPNHNHQMLATTSGQAASPQNNIPAQPSGNVQGMMTYAAATPSTALVGTSIQSSGGNQPHENMQPYLCVSFIISLFGIFPTPN